MYGIKETKSQICATGFFVRSASKHSSLKKVKIWCTIVNQFEVDIRIIFYFIQVWIWDVKRTLIYTLVEWWKNNIFLIRIFFSLWKISIFLQFIINHWMQNRILFIWMRIFLVWRSIELFRLNVSYLINLLRDGDVSMIFAV